MGGATASMVWWSGRGTSRRERGRRRRKFLRRRWGKELKEGGRESGEKVLSLRSMISTCPRLDVNANRKREVVKVAPFVHNALAVRCFAGSRGPRRARESEGGRRSAGREV